MTPAEVERLREQMETSLKSFVSISEELPPIKSGAELAMREHADSTYKRTISTIAALCRSWTALHAENERMRKALEWYANKENWALREDGSNFRSEIDPDDLQEFRPNRKAEYCGGKRAREALQPIEEGK